MQGCFLSLPTAWMLGASWEPPAPRASLGCGRATSQLVPEELALCPLNIAEESAARPGPELTSMQQHALVGPGDWATAHSWAGKSCWCLLVLKCECRFLGWVLLLGGMLLMSRVIPLPTCTLSLEQCWGQICSHIVKSSLGGSSSGAEVWGLQPLSWGCLSKSLGLFRAVVAPHM